LGKASFFSLDCLMRQSDFSKFCHLFFVLSYNLPTFALSFRCTLIHLPKQLTVVFSVPFNKIFATTSEIINSGSLIKGLSNDNKTNHPHRKWRRGQMLIQLQQPSSPFSSSLYDDGTPFSLQAVRGNQDAV
jgi:hypothetical protein